MAVHLPPEQLIPWLEAASAELGVESSESSIRTVLDVAKHVAHSVARPAAPLSTFLLGVALGRAEEGTDLDQLASQLIDLAARWDAELEAPKQDS